MFCITAPRRPSFVLCSGLRDMIPQGCDLTMETIVSSDIASLRDLLEAFSAEDRRLIREIRRRAKNRVSLGRHFHSITRLNLCGILEHLNASKYIQDDSLIFSNLALCHDEPAAAAAAAAAAAVSLHGALRPDAPL